jgi:hypothetical protein
MQVRDPLTGMSIYSYNQKQHTVTSGVGQGVIEKVHCRTFFFFVFSTFEPTVE